MYSGHWGMMQHEVVLRLSVQKKWSASSKHSCDIFKKTRAWASAWPQAWVETSIIFKLDLFRQE